MFADIRPVLGVQRSDEYQVAVVWSITPFAQQGAVWRQSVPLAGALNDDLVAGVGQALQGAVGQDGVSKRLSHSSTARFLVMTKLDDRCRLRMSS